MSENIESGPDAKKTSVAPRTSENCQFELVKLIHRVNQLSHPPIPVYFALEELHALLKEVITTRRDNSVPLIELSAPVKVVGNLHGHYGDLLQILSGNIFRILHGTDNIKYVFLGNYIDYGACSLETIVLLLALQLAAPDNFFLLRGTREVPRDGRECGLYAELFERFGSSSHEYVYSLMTHFEEAFSWMPVAALISKRILCVHGGISPELNSLDDIRKIKMPFESPIDDQLIIDLLWAEPDMTAKGFEWKKETDGNKKEAEMWSKKSMYETLRAKYMPHVRGKLWTPKTRIFGEKEVEEVCKKLKIDKIICGGKIDKTGYTVYPGKRLVTVFSALYHDEPFKNEAAFVTVSKDCELNFVQLNTKCYVFHEVMNYCDTLEVMRRREEYVEEIQAEEKKKKEEEKKKKEEEKKKKEEEKEKGKQKDPAKQKEKTKEKGERKKNKKNR